MHNENGLRAWPLSAALALGIFAMPVQAGSVGFVVKQHNGPWTVGQQQGVVGATNPTAAYTISLTHTRSSGSNQVTVTDVLPSGIWPAWSGTRTSGGYNCTYSFNASNKRYTVTCQHPSAPAGTGAITLPVWIDQLAVGTVNNTVTTLPAGLPPVPASTNVTRVREVPSNRTCESFGGTLGINAFDNNGTFGALGSNTVGAQFQVYNPGPALPAGRTDFNHDPGGWMDDGDYRLSNRMSQGTGRDGEWFWTVGDHTSINQNGGKGDPNQLMMLVNASHIPTVFYRQRVAVTPNVNYEFSLWAMHANNPNSRYFFTPPPNGAGRTPLPFDLAFAVNRIGIDDDNDGQVDEAGEAQQIVTSGETAATAIPTWRQFAAVFNTGGATEVEFIFRNDGPGGPGNDLALDDLMMGTCSGLPSGNIQGSLYYDDNRNDQLDGSETGRLPANIAVELVNSDGLIVATVFTDANGNYLFQNIPTLPNASYTVRVITTDTDVPNGATIGTAQSVPITFTQGGTVTTNFGFDATTLTLAKTWANAVINDAVAITATRAGSSIATLNAVANTAAETDTGTSVIVVAGDAINFTENFTTGGAANYATTLACTGAADTNPADGLTINAADRQIVCTYTNTRRLADLWIDKSNTPGQNNETDQPADSVTQGAQTSYVLRIGNNGPMTANNAVVSDVPGQGLTGCSVTACSGTGGATCPADTSGVLTAAGAVIPLLPVGGRVDITVICTVAN